MVLVAGQNALAAWNLQENDKDDRGNHEIVYHAPRLQHGRVFYEGDF